MPRLLSRNLTLHLTIEGERVSHTLEKPNNNVVAQLYRECVRAQTLLNSLQELPRNSVDHQQAFQQFFQAQQSLATFWDDCCQSVEGYICDGSPLNFQDESWRRLIPVEDKIRAIIQLLAPQSHGIPEKKS
jgi:hypothetical protein